MTRAALVAAFLALAGCGHVPTPGTQPVPGPDEGAWAVERDAHTRSVKLYDGLATRAFATATWEAPSVRTARAERTATWKAMTAEERAKALAAEDAAASSFDEFTISLFTADHNDNDLTFSQTVWRISIVAADGTESIGPKVTEVRADALVRTLYPYVGDFDTVYRVRFARRPEATEKPFVLRIAGPRGRMDFPFTP
jgi:hypothetical protein